MPLGPGEKLLLASHAWQKDGKCRFDDECKFAHEGGSD